MICGGFSTADKAEARNLFHSLESEISSKLGTNSILEFVSAESQVVAGMNYRITFTVDGKKHVATIWRKLDGTSELTDLQ